MRTWRRSRTLLLLLSSAYLSGCHTTHAGPAPAHQSPSKSPTPPPPPGKHPPRDSAVAVYNNPEYGVSFRYPRNYSLEDQDFSEESTAEFQQKLQTEQPGAKLVASIEIPSDAYPNTTFRSGTLQLAVHPALSPETCQSLAVPADDAYTSGSISTRAMNFHWRQRGWAAAGTAYLNRDYAGFSNGTCYEFFIEIVSGSNPDADPLIKEVDTKKITQQFEKIVNTLQIHRALKPSVASQPLN